MIDSLTFNKLYFTMLIPLYLLIEISKSVPSNNLQLLAQRGTLGRIFQGISKSLHALCILYSDPSFLRPTFYFWSNGKFPVEPSVLLHTLSQPAPHPQLACGNKNKNKSREKSSARGTYYISSVGLGFDWVLISFQFNYTDSFPKHFT